MVYGNLVELSRHNKSDDIIQLNEDLIKHDLKDLVRSSVEDPLNVLFDEEADILVNVHKYEQLSDCQGC